MSFFTIDSVLEDLKLTHLYQQKLRDENLSNYILVMIIEDKDETLKEELRSVVASAGHRFGIMNAYRIKSELAKKAGKGYTQTRSDIPVAEKSSGTTRSASKFIRSFVASKE
ncbi:unnamed protein product [Allacma fusca]|uniref:Uncharacterized protein n=1 Tax=Allacma fusca TaxID=39272 RepID=A0A8J2P9K1_9HEXA|nr:unnamed protein product [Allacma fusca]